MKGKHKIIVQNNKLRYEMEIKRNITIIQGNSATGKTILIDMLRQATNYGESSGVHVRCDVPCRILGGRDWKLILQNISGNIIFIDEENAFIKTEDFASAIKESDNYYVLITRENLYNLPYSVEEIYGLHSSGKYQNTTKVYQQLYHIYSGCEDTSVRPDKIVTEDSNAGYEFFSNVCADKGVICESAEGKSNLFSVLENENDKEICVIADGAAIGPEMSKLYHLVKHNKNIKLYLPESFEWLILKSGLFDSREIRNILEHPEDYIESEKYFSWERYFTNLIMNVAKETYMKYNKNKLNPVYLHEKNKDVILKSIEGIVLFQKDVD